MMRNLQPGLSENPLCAEPSGLRHLPQHGIRVEVPPRGGNLFAHAGRRTISCGRPVRGRSGRPSS